MISLFSSEGCESLFFEWPKKSNQKKGPPTIWSLRDFPVLLAFIGAKINSVAVLPQTNFRLTQ